MCSGVKVFQRCSSWVLNRTSVWLLLINCNEMHWTFDIWRSFYPNLPPKGTPWVRPHGWAMGHLLLVQNSVEFWTSLWVCCMQCRVITGRVIHMWSRVHFKHIPDWGKLRQQSLFPIFSYWAIRRYTLCIFRSSFNAMTLTCLQHFCHVALFVLGVTGQVDFNRRVERDTPVYRIGPRTPIPPLGRMVKLKI